MQLREYHENLTKGHPSGKTTSQMNCPLIFLKRKILAVSFWSEEHQHPLPTKLWENSKKFCKHLQVGSCPHGNSPSFSQTSNRVGSVVKADPAQLNFLS